MLNNFIDNKSSSIKAKIIGTLIFCFSTAICLALLLPYSVKHYPILVAFGVVSFALTGVIIILLLVINGLLTVQQLRKHHPDLLKNSISSSRNTRSEAIRQIKYLKDPRLKKISACMTKIGIVCFFILIKRGTRLLLLELLCAEILKIRSIFCFL